MQKLRELRKVKGYTIAGLAREVGVSLHTVFRWEHGTSSPNADELKKLSILLNTTPNELLGIKSKHSEVRA